MAVVVLTSCNLADPPEIHCPAGSHADLGHCVADTAAGGNELTIDVPDGGASCSAAPDPFSTGVGVPFAFVNHDGVSHEIRGADGQLWTTVAAGATSDPAISLSKAGSWPYTISGCTKGGTIVVR